MKMIGLMILILFLICYILYRIYRFAMSQSEREKEFWLDQKVYGSRIGLRFYTLMKILLGIVAIGGILFLFISLVYGHTPTLRDFRNPEFLKIAFGVGLLLLPQIAIFGLVKLLKNTTKCNTGKVVWFFLIIGGIAALLITGICLAAF